MWLFSEDFGARYLTYSNGKFQATDYTTKNGKLIGDHQLQMTEDAKQNVWIASDKGLNRITPDGKSHLKLKNQHIITLTTDGNHIAVLTDKGDAFLYDNSGKLVRKSHLPSMMGYVGKSRASFFWQGEWYIFTQEETFAMNLKTGIFHKPANPDTECHVEIFLKSYEFLYDKKGNAYLFSKNGNSIRNSICWTTRLTSTVETRTSWLPKMPTEMYISYLMVTDSSSTTGRKMNSSTSQQLTRIHSSTPTSC